MPKNVQTTVQLPSSDILAKYSKSKQAFSDTWTENFQMLKLDLEKAEEPEIKLPTFCWIIEKAREFQKNIYFCFIDYTKAFDCAKCQAGWSTNWNQDCQEKYQ